MDEILYKTWFHFLKQFQINEDMLFAYKKPAELGAKLNLALSEEGEFDEKTLQNILDQVVKYTPKVRSLTYLNYFYSSPDPIGLIGDWLISLMNTNVHAYEASPVFTLVETELIKSLAKIVGYKTKSDGIFCPGGSYSNMLAMYLARKRFYPESSDNGLCNNKERPVIFTSEQAHYSIDRAAALLGIGTKFVRKIECDQKGRIIPKYLDEKIKQAVSQGEQPFFVSATSGTTVLGGFDPLAEIKEVLLPYKRIWLHTDAAWGGAVLMSEKHCDLVKGIEGTDSATWDFHKALSAPILCSALLVKDGTDLKNLFNDADTSYLFHYHDDEEAEKPHLGEKTLQCGRRGDAFKFWLMWKMRGKRYFAGNMEKRFAIAAQAVEIIKSKKCFWIYNEQPDFWNIAFWYVPEHLRHLQGITQCTEQDRAELDKLTVNISRRMERDGQVLVNYSKLKDIPSFIRLVINNNEITENLLYQIFEIIGSAGDVLSSCNQNAN